MIGENKENTIIDAEGEGSVIYLNAYYVANEQYIKISGFTIKNNGNNWLNHDSGIELDDCYFVNIHNNIFYDNIL